MNKKTKNLFIMGFFIVIIVYAFVGCKPLDEQATSPTATSTALPVTLGFCPTMRPYVQRLIDSGHNFRTIQFDNSSQAIQALKSGLVQAALVGRTARQSEISEDIRLNRIEDGYTLIGQIQALLPYEELIDVRVFTLEESKDAAAILPPGTSITYYQNFDQMMSDLDRSSAVLLRWSEVPNSFQLLIPVDGQGNKIPEFRSPHVYFNSTLGFDFSEMIGALSLEEACPIDLDCSD